MAKQFDMSGSGHLYFDISAPENNYEPIIRYHNSDYTDSQMIENSSKIAGYFLYEKEHYEQDKLFLKKLLNEPAIQAPLIYRDKECHNMRYFENNRDNFLHTINMFPLTRNSEEDLLFVKDLVKLGLSLGVHPLEKSARFGQSAFALALGNSDMPFDMLKFWASLHPNSFTDLSEEKETVMQLVLRANRKPEIVNWVAESIPLDFIEENIKSIAKKAKSSKRAANAIDSMRARLEVEKIETLLPAAPTKTRKNKI